jgi:serine phosphatase RsbU (regulator of sigma subunit)
VCDRDKNIVWNRWMMFNRVKYLVMKKIIFLFFSVAGFSSFAGRYNDSLRNVIQTSRNDSVKTMAYQALFFANINEPATALEIISEAKLFASGLSDLRTKAFCTRKIGTFYHRLNYFDKGLEYYISASELYEKIDDKEGLSNCYNNIANAYASKGELTTDILFFDRAIEYHLKCINMRRESQDTTQINNSYNNIGIAYMYKEDFKQALLYFNSAYKAFSKYTKDNNALDMITLNLGDVYMKMGFKENKREYFNKALMYYKDRLDQYKSYGPTDRHATVMSRVGQIMCAIDECRGALKFLDRAVEMAKAIKNKGSIVETSYQYAKALEKEGQTELALEYMHLYNVTKDSLVNERNRAGTEQMAALYNSTQKDRKIEQLNTENEVKAAKLGRQRVVMFSFIGGFTLLLLLGFVLLSRYNLKKKANKQLGEAYSKIEAKNRQITDSINYAKRIQNAILPPDKILEEHFKNVFVFYAPKDIVSGDFYWFSKQNGKLFFVVADCTGHGVPGALMSMIGNTLLNEIVNQKHISDPGEILYHLDTGVSHALHQDTNHVLSQDDGMDVSVCVMDEKVQNKLWYASANHSLFIKRENGVEEVRGDIFSVGGGISRAAKLFNSKAVDLNEGDFVVMSTDGYYDQFGGSDDRKFLITRFEELISRSELSETVFKAAFENWKGHEKQTDDVLVAGFKV